MNKETVKTPTTRILIVIDSLKTGGGAERVAATLCDQLAARGYETRVLTFYHAAHRHKVNGVYQSFHEISATSKLGKVWKLAKRCWQMQRIIRRHRIDVTISFLEPANICALVTKLAFLARRPVVVSLRSYPLKKKLLYRTLIRRLYPFADRVVSVSRGAEAALQNRFGLSNIVTIYNPIDGKKVQQMASAGLPETYQWLETRSPLFVSIGNLTKPKGQWHLIRAFQKAAKRHPDAALVILGEGRLRADLERLVHESGLDGKVFLPGLQKNVFPFLKAADCFVFTSLWEGMPNALLEALAVGLPIIATDCPTGPREILAPGLPLEERISYPYRAAHGTLIAPFSGEEIYAGSERVPLSAEEEALADLMAGVAERKEKTFAREEALARFDMEEVVGRWETLIRDCAVGK